MTAFTFSHDLLGGRHDDFISPIWLTSWHNHVVDVVGIALVLEHLGLVIEACLMFILKHGLDQFPHDRPFLSFDFPDFNLLLLIFLSHFVEIYTKLVGFFIELSLLAEV